MGLVALLVFTGRVVIEPLLRLLVWSGILVAWWWFVDSFFFVCVGVPCGYVIANPVLCCAASPYSCVLVKQVGIYGLLALYMIAAGGSLLGWLYRSRVCSLIALLFFCILSMSALREHHNQKKLKTCRAVAYETDRCTKKKRAPWECIVSFQLTGKETSVLGIALKLQRQFLACSEQAHAPDLIVGPETFLPCALNNEQSLCALFDNPGVCLVPRVLVGARRQDEKCFNSAFMLHQGRIIFYYDKLFPLPFLETYSEKTLAGKMPYTAGTGAGDVTLSLGGVTYHARLALCSDFFCTDIFSTVKNFSQENPLLVVLTHDSWFYGNSVADCMHRYAVLWAVHNQVPILYSGNCCVSWIESSGRVWPLARVDS